MNPPNYPHENFSHPIDREKIQTKQGAVTEIIFLAKLEINLVTVIYRTLKNKIAMIPKNIIMISIG